MNNKLVTWINQEIKRRGWTIRETARRAGVSHTAINNVLSEQVSPTLHTYRGLSHAFQISLEAILRMAGELPSLAANQQGSDPLLDELITLYNTLSVPDKAAAVRFLRGLVLTTTDRVPTDNT